MVGSVWHVWLKDGVPITPPGTKPHFPLTFLRNSLLGRACTQSSSLTCCCDGASLHAHMGRNGSEWASMGQHASISMGRHMPARAWAGMGQYGSAYVSTGMGQHGSARVSMGQHGSAWVSMGQHMSAREWVSTGQHGSARASSPPTCCGDMVPS